MPRIIGPNGLSVNVSDQTAEMLLRNKGDYELDRSGAPPKAAKAEKTGKSGKSTKKADAAASNPASTPPPEKPVWPAGTAEAWKAYASHIGVAVEGLDRSGIREAVEAHEAAPNPE